MTMLLVKIYNSRPIIVKTASELDIFTFLSVTLFIQQSLAINSMQFVNDPFMHLAQQQVAEYQVAHELVKWTRTHHVYTLY